MVIKPCSLLWSRRRMTAYDYNDDVLKKAATFAPWLHNLYILTNCMHKLFQ